MDADPWTACLSSVSKRYQSALGSRSDLFMGFDDIDVDDGTREEFPCPFCSEYLDIVGLCCHIDDEHHVDAKDRNIFRKEQSSPLSVEDQAESMRRSEFAHELLLSTIC